MIVILGIQFVGAPNLVCLSLLVTLLVGLIELCIQLMELAGLAQLLQLLMFGIQFVGVLNLVCS